MATASGTPIPQLPDWRVIWHDDFDTGTRPDPKTYTLYNNPTPANGSGAKSPAQAIVHDSMLTLRVTKRADGSAVCAGGDMNPSFWAGPQIAPFALRTCARWTSGEGIKPIMLLWPTADGVWPPEIDFIETSHVGPGPKQLMLTTHYPKGGVNRVNAQHGPVQLNGDWTTWHVIGVDWLPADATHPTGQVIYTIDGKVVATHADAPQIPMRLGFNHNFFDVTNLPVGNYDYDIDWIAYYKPQEAPVALTATFDPTKMTITAASDKRVAAATAAAAGEQATVAYTLPITLTDSTGHIWTLVSDDGKTTVWRF